MKTTEGQYLDALKTVRGYLKQIELEINTKIENKNPILNKKIYDIGFGTRLENALLRSSVGFDIVKDIVKFKRKDLFTLRNFGHCSMNELENWMEENNLSFGMLNK